MYQRLVYSAILLFGFYVQASVTELNPSGRDYLGEVRNAQTDAGWLTKLAADPAILQYQARTAKMFDFVDHEPHVFFEQMRADEPIFQIPAARGKVIDPDAIKGLKGISKTLNLPPIFVLSRYDDVTKVMHENKIFAVQAYAGPIISIVGGPFMLAGDESSANQEKGDVSNQLDARARIAQIRHIVDHLAQEAIREGTQNGELDIVKSVTRAIPLGMNSEYFGFNGPNQATLARWTKAAQMSIFYNFGQDQNVFQAAANAGEEMQTYLRDQLLPERMLELKNGRPANDVISRLLTLSELHKRHGVSSERIIANIIGLLVGSVETTSAAISQSLNVILSQPDVRARAIAAAMANDDDTMAKIVWEALRFQVVNHWVARIAQEDFVLAPGTARETRIPAGALILASTESAMFDESVFPNPNAFKLDRDQSLFLHFGYEYHRCLGVDVAGTMVPESVKELLKLKDLQIEEPIQIVGPFPEKFLLHFDRLAVPPYAPVDLSSPEKWADALTFDGYAAGHGAPPAARANLLASLGEILNHGPTPEKISAIPDQVEDALSEVSTGDEQKLCREQNALMQDQFADATSRAQFCALPTSFRACYAAQTGLNEQSSFTAYYACAFGEKYLSADEIAAFKNNFSGLDRFYFLNDENMGSAHAAH